MAWDKGRPIEGGMAPDLNNVIILNNAALESALDAYIRFETGGTQTGQPRQGSARFYFQDTAPTARLDGDYFDSTDLGTPWIDSNSDPDNQFNILTAADGAGTETWTPISTEVIAVLLAAERAFAEVITFSKSPVFTLGIVGNDSYIVGRNNAGDGNINIAKVNTSDGVTLGAVTTLPDTSALATSGAPAADAQLANKKYVDDRRAYIKLVDSKAAGTNGGTATAGSWEKRTVAEETDTGDNCSVASSVIVLAAGTYECIISCPAYGVNNHQARLRNTTAGTTVLIGTNERTKADEGIATRSFIVGRFTIAASQNLEIQHRVLTTLADIGHGYGHNFGEVNIYTIAEFWKI